MEMNERPVPAPPPGEFAAATLRDHGEELRRFLRRRVVRSQDLADLVQEVYLRLLRINVSESVRDPLAYVFGIAANVASEFQMRERRSRTVYDSELMQTAADAADELPEGDGGAYFEHQVNQALAALPPMKLAVLLLERREGLSQAQIAEKLGLSVHTVKKYNVEALAQVRASLQR